MQPKRRAKNKGRIYDTCRWKWDMSTILGNKASFKTYLMTAAHRSLCSRPRWCHTLRYPPQFYVKLGQSLDTNDKMESRIRELTSHSKSTMKQFRSIKFKSGPVGALVPAKKNNSNMCRWWPVDPLQKVHLSLTHLTSTDLSRTNEQERTASPSSYPLSSYHLTIDCRRQIATNASMPSS